MILLIAGALALLVIYAGIKLLIQTQKEALGNRYKCAAWFFIVSGFLIIGLAVISCVAMFFMHGHKMMGKEHKMMKMHGRMMEEYPDRYGHMGFTGHRGHKKRIQYEHGMCSEGCNIFINGNPEGEEPENCNKMCKTDSTLKRETKR